MSLPYESNATDWTKIRCIKAWIEYPFADDGDTTSKIYRMLCMCKNASYSAPAFSDVMSSATVAKLVSLPFTADSNAYFVGDSDFQPSDGGTIQFVRSFAPVPSARSRGIGSVSHTWPAIRKWTSEQNAYWTFSTTPFDADLVPPGLIVRDALTASSPGEITYTYQYATAIGSVTTDTLWTPTHWTSGIPAIYQGQPTDNYLYDYGVTFSKASIPDATDYQADYIGQEYVIISSSIKSWMGNIFVRETVKALAQ